MVSKKQVDEQLKRIGFKSYGWGRAEVSELPNIILPDEEIFECVNGIYEGGFALLLASDVRVLLIDKKPLNYLTVEDLRFDMINELDYNHRLFGAYISISAGNKNLKFRSYNQPRLRKLIGHVQHCMAEIKKKQVGHQEGQQQHLEQINQQLQTYLIAQYQQQQKMHEQLQTVQTGNPAAALPEPPEPIRPSPELADYLYAQGLLAQHQLQAGQPEAAVRTAPAPPAIAQVPITQADPSTQLADLYADGMQEIYGKHDQRLGTQVPAIPIAAPAPQPVAPAHHHPLEINPLRIAYSKLPMALRSRKFGKAPGLASRGQTEPLT